MCDQGHKVTFDSQNCEIRKKVQRNWLLQLQVLQETYMC
jgi:hypothetical protein